MKMMTRFGQNAPVGKTDEYEPRTLRNQWFWTQAGQVDIVVVMQTRKKCFIKTSRVLKKDKISKAQFTLHILGTINTDFNVFPLVKKSFYFQFECLM